MSGVTINGVQTWGALHQLKEGVSLATAHQKGQKDGLDQVYFSANGKNYFIEGDGLDLSGIRKSAAGSLPKITFSENGKAIESELRIENVDDENSKVNDFLFKNPLSIAGGVITGGAVISQIPRMLNNIANHIPFVGNGSTLASPKAIGIAAAVGVGLMAIGAYSAYAQRETKSNVQELGQKIEAAPEKSTVKKGWDTLTNLSLF